jgi:tetratricopeptide (TPR) repeat protein
LQEGLSKEPFTPLICHCSPYHQDTPLHPVIGQLLRTAAIEREVTAETKLYKLEVLLGQSSKDMTEDMPLVAALLSIPGGDRYPLSGLTPQQLKERTFKTLLRQLTGLADRQPVLLVFEDLHWIDPTSLELLSAVVDGIVDKSVLVVATARPEFTAPWPSHRHVSTLPLGRLGRAEGQGLVGGVTKGKALPAEVLDQIIARTDGIPLFIEELTKTVLESGALRESDDKYELIGPLPSLAIPSTLHASLLARLDRLASAKNVAQIGATVGREFSYAMVAAVSTIAEQVLRAALSQLVEAELIFQHGVPPDARYQFKHALVQDAAYATLLRSQRQRMHERVAEALQTWPEPVPATIMAHHFAEAGKIDQAVAYLIQASEHAVQRGENREAVSHLQRAIQLLDSILDDDATKKKKLDVLLRYGPVVFTAVGLQAKEARDIYSRAHALASVVGDTRQRFIARWGLWYASHLAGTLEDAHEHIKEPLEIASVSSDKMLILQAHHSAWTTFLPSGRDAEVVKHTEIGWANYDPQSSPTHIFLFGGHDAGVCSCMMGSLALWSIGALDRARTAIEQGISLSQRLDHPFSMGMILSFAATVGFLLREQASLLAHVDRLVALSERHSFSLGYAMATAKLLRGWAYAVAGDSEKALQDLNGGLTALKQTGFKRMAFQYAVTASAALAMGDRARAQGAIEGASQALMEAPEPRWEPEVLRLKGILCEDAVMAESIFRQAIAAARGNASPSFELRAATNLAQLLITQGRTTEAKALLAPIYAKFKEGFNTLDLKDAKAQLEGPTFRYLKWPFFQRSSK